jgi:hypothetical protein
MAVNPAEDIVNVWLQDAQGYFTRQNINVPKGKRMIQGKAIYGGRGKEIDILAVNIKGDKLWVEVTVSPNPYLSKSANRISDAIKKVQEKFCPEKETEVRRLFGRGRIRKLFVYSRRIFRKDQESEFLKKLKVMGKIEAKPFEVIFKEIINGINHYSVDPVRIYLYYSKYFGGPSVVDRAPRSARIKDK